MDGAYFVSRSELLGWLNDLLGLDYTKVEQTCTGAAHCQIMDMLYPGRVPLSKVNFNARHDYEYIQNYKILQTVFQKCGVEKIIDVSKLIKGRMQDNLEFLQWMKHYWDLHNPGGEYDGPERRRQSGIRLEFDSQSLHPTNTAPAVSTGRGRVTPTVTAAPVRPKPVTTKPTSVQQQTPADRKPSAAQDIPDPWEQVRILKNTVDVFQHERDWYWKKLREIEVLCQNHKNPAADTTSFTNVDEFVESVLAVLYAPDPEGEEHNNS
ncbi:microtubule-associated protein, RP/EB family [Pelomyxa schiedti]|nr:microtubule-associated protein, RP/EB family [Pelomyxa schiedti]